VAERRVGVVGGGFGVAERIEGSTAGSTQQRNIGSVSCAASLLMPDNDNGIAVIDV
jgi:hypothetical protein